MSESFRDEKKKTKKIRRKSVLLVEDYEYKRKHNIIYMELWSLDAAPVALWYTFIEQKKSLSTEIASSPFSSGNQKPKKEKKEKPKLTFIWIYVIFCLFF